MVDHLASTMVLMGCGTGSRRGGLVGVDSGLALGASGGAACEAVSASSYSINAEGTSIVATYEAVFNVTTDIAVGVGWHPLGVSNCGEHVRTAPRAKIGTMSSTVIDVSSVDDFASHKVVLNNGSTTAVGGVDGSGVGPHLNTRCALFGDKTRKWSHD